MIPQPSETSVSIETRDEATLVAGLRFLDDAAARSAFAELYRRHAAGLLRFAYGYVRTQAAAEDIVADVFLSLWMRRTLWDPQHGVSAYLYAAVRRRALNVHRGERRAAHWHAAAAEDAQGERAGSERDGEGDMTYAFGDDQPALQQALQRAIASLPEDARRIAELRWRDGMTPSEISTILGINRAAVDNRLSRLIKRLRASLDRAE